MPPLSRGHFVGGLAAGAVLMPLAARAAAPPTVRIGYIESMSGPFADVAARQHAGVMAAINEANSRGRVKYEVVLADDTTKPAEGLNAARRLIEQDKVDVLMIGVLSGTALQVGPVAEEAGVFVLCIQPQDTSITGTHANRIMYRLVPNARMLSAALARQVLAIGKKWYFLQSDFAFGRDGYAHLSDHLKRAGGTEVGHDIFPLTMTDFSSLLTKVRDSDADVLMLAHGGLAAAQICKQMVGFGLQKRMHVGTMNMEDYYQDILPMDGTRGITAGIMWSPLASDSAMRLATKLKRVIPGQLSYRHYLGYIAMMQMIDRINAAGTTAAGAVVDAFANHSYDSAQARPSMWRGADHQNQTDTYAGTLVSSKKFRQTGLLYDIAADVAGAEAIGPATEPDAAAANAIISAQKVPVRQNYTPVVTR